MKLTVNDLESAQLETLAVHAGEYVDPATRSSSPTLVMSSTFAPREVTGFSARDEEAYENYQKLLSETPDYPDAPAILTKLLDLARKLGKADDAARYDAQLHPPAPPRPAATNNHAATNSGAPGVSSPRRDGNSRWRTP